MACSINITSQSKDCSANIGGVRCIYVASRADVAAQGSPGQTPNTWDIYLSGNAGIFKRFAVQPGSSSYTSTAQVDEGNGTGYFRDEAVAVLNKISTDKLFALMQLWGGDFVAVIEDRNGQKTVMGYDNDINDVRVMVGAAEIGTGTAKTDRNGLQVTLSCEHRNPPMVLDPTSPSTIFDTE